MSGLASAGGGGGGGGGRGWRRASPIVFVDNDLSMRLIRTHGARMVRVPFNESNCIYLFIYYLFQVVVDGAVK